MCVSVLHVIRMLSSNGRRARTPTRHSTIPGTEARSRRCAKRFRREEVSFTASRHCGGCHDPVLLLSGAMDHPIKPEDRLVNSGVTCLVCHSVRAPTSDGNASYTLTTAPVPIPVDGDPTSLARRHGLAAHARFVRELPPRLSRAPHGHRSSSVGHGRPRRMARLCVR
jgi:hypothetical protein